MFAEIQEASFNQDFLYQRLLDNANKVSKGNSGAIVTFTGLVRDSNAAGTIEGIELEHYPGMTENALNTLVEQAISRFSLNAAGAVHRVGKLYNQDPIVWVGCAAPHRQAAFDAAVFLMDMLKQSVPLWKKEFSGDESNWVEAKTSDDKAALKWMKK
jgi:molybdopterin synthase catalytic subunit